MTLEGMKMEVIMCLSSKLFIIIMQTNILSPEDGIIKTLYYDVGDIIPGGSKLIDFEEPSDSQ